MEYNKMVSNPLLIGAIEVVKAENTPEHRKLVSDQIVQGTYLCPASVTPVPEIDDKGKVKMAEQTKIQFPVLQAPNGKHFFMAFTDKKEFDKWSGSKDSQFFAASFEDYIGLLMKKDESGNSNNVNGFVINPYGANLIVPREMIESYANEKIAKIKAAREAQAEKNNK